VNVLTVRDGKLWDGERRWIGTGTNLPGQAKWGHAAAPDDPAVARALVDDLVAHNVNCVRVMQADEFDYPVGIWAGATRDVRWLQRFDVFVAACADAGIRIDLAFDQSALVLSKVGLTLKDLRTPGPAREALKTHYRWFWDHVNTITGVRYGADPVFYMTEPFNERNHAADWGAADPAAERSLNDELRAAIKAMAPHVVYLAGQCNYVTAGAYDASDATDMHLYAARSPSGYSPNPAPGKPARVYDDIWMRRSTLLGDMAGSTYGSAHSWAWGHRHAGKPAGHTEVGVGVSRHHLGAFFPIVGVLGALHDMDWLFTFCWRPSQTSYANRPGDLAIEGYPCLVYAHEIIAKLRAWGGIAPMPANTVPILDEAKRPEWKSVGTGPNHAYAMRRMVVDRAAPAAVPIPANTNTVRVQSAPGVEWDFEAGVLRVSTPTVAMVAGVIPALARVGAMTLDAPDEWLGVACWISDDGSPLGQGRHSLYCWRDSLPAGFAWTAPGEYTGWGAGANTNMPAGLRVTLDGERQSVLRPQRPKIVLG
jgi:hypothetical protein